ncbi:hypothetical protein A1O1_05870 [Capronia coronata CBS 617.96]|uniref:SET domain-containing protein n=1 Tax=Capronia coronata CBS 617.96 TaxID=1182541 RepID=W9Y8E7_9EURO|nr:uncharacterized protein A1O1_05870 [Capronia coronata CBS 617.96]EXJ85506.1 hypothetical protein A1O1_05870 [Capronia coronata CBS 617.96]
MKNTWSTLISISLAFGLVSATATATADTHDPVYQVAFEQLLQSGQLDLISETDDTKAEPDTSIDTDTNSFAHGPWSYPPACTSKLDSLGSELCVYTNISFARGRGISLFTTPRIAEQIAELAPFHDHDNDHDNDHDRDHSKANKANEANKIPNTNIPPVRHEVNEFQVTWYTRSTTNKGMGMFAKKDLRRGDLITAYTPVLIAYSENTLLPSEREKFLQLAINQLPEPTRESYLRLATVYGDPRIVVQDIASANTFGVLFPGTVGSRKKKKNTAAADAESAATEDAASPPPPHPLPQHLAVIPEPSRINHACNPNAQFQIDTTQLIHRVYAVRPIGRNEEITIAYTNPLDNYATRQRYLKQFFGFTCACARCSIERQRREDAPDAAIAEINALQAILADWTATSDSDSDLDSSGIVTGIGSGSVPGNRIKLAERLIKVYLDEGLHGYLDPAYCHAALAYSAAGSLRGVQKYLDLAIEAIRLRLGPDAPDLVAWEEMRRDPTRHWSWRWSKRKK